VINGTGLGVSSPISTIQGKRAASWLSRATTLPLVIFVAALGMRLIGLGSRPFWLDEVFTLQRVRLAPGALVHDSLIAHHMPTYFLLLSVLAPLDNPQFWLRMPSAILGALAVMLVYLIGQRIAGRTAGLVAALVLGLSPAALAYSQEARSYSLVMSLILLALLGLTQLAMDIPAASVPLRDRTAARRAWILFMAASICAVDVLADAFLWVITANLIMAVMVTQSSRRKALLGNLLIADLCILLFSVPFYIIMALTITQTFTNSVGWIPPLSGARLWYNFGSIYLMRIADTVTFKLIDVATPSVISWTIDAGLILAVGFGAWWLRRKPAVLALLGFSFLVLPVVLTTISLWQPVLLPRYILWSAAPFAVLAGIGASLCLNKLPRWGQMAAIACIAVLLLINLAPYYSAETKPRWDIAAKMLAEDVAPGDVVFLDDQYAPAELKVYLPKAEAAAVLNNAVPDLQAAQLAKAQGKRVWTVYGIAGQIAYDDDWPEFAASMAPLGTPAQIQMAGNRIYITLFEPAGN
jgi:mannosyltransferase